MICANCKSDKCPAPAGEQTYVECGNGYGVVTIGETVLPVIVDSWRARAEVAEAEVKALRATIAKARAHLHPGIQLSNASYQEGYRYAAAQVLAILGEA